MLLKELVDDESVRRYQRTLAILFDTHVAEYCPSGYLRVRADLQKIMTSLWSAIYVVKSTTLMRISSITCLILRLLVKRLEVRGEGL
jgi:hypothetical protein